MAPPDTPGVPSGFGVNGRQPESFADFEVRTLPEGSLLRLADGREIRLVDNPHDGVWLVCEEVGLDEEPLDEVETVLCYDVAALVRLGPAHG